MKHRLISIGLGLLIYAVCLPGAVLAQTTSGSTIARSPTSNGQTSTVFTYKDKSPTSSAGFATILLAPSMPDQVWPLTLNTGGEITVALGGQPNTYWGFSADDAAHWRKGALYFFNDPPYLYDFGDYYINGFNGKGSVSADAQSWHDSAFHISSENFVACWSPGSEDPLVIKGPPLSSFNVDDSRYTSTDSEAQVLGFGSSLIVAMELTDALGPDGYFYGTWSVFLYLGVSGAASTIDTSDAFGNVTLKSAWSVIYDSNLSGAYIGRLYTPSTGVYYYTGNKSNKVQFLPLSINDAGSILGDDNPYEVAHAADDNVIIRGGISKGDTVAAWLLQASNGQPVVKPFVLVAGSRKYLNGIDGATSVTLTGFDEAGNVYGAITSETSTASSQNVIWVARPADWGLPGTTSAYSPIPWQKPALPPNLTSLYGIRPNKNRVELGIASGTVMQPGSPDNGNVATPLTGTFAFAVFPADLRVDANRDGLIKLAAEDDSDATSPGKPFRFWINDDDDHASFPGDVGQEHAPIVRPDYSSNFISSQRDLEDYARLWISLQGLNDAFQTGQLQLGLKWSDVSSGSPAIKLFRAVEADGGTGYLTDGTANGVAQRQASQYALIDQRYAGEDESSSTHTTIGGADVFILPQSQLADLSATQTQLHLLFEGCSAGKGQLKLIILDAAGNQIGEGPGIWMDLHNVENFYDKARAINVTSGKPPSNLLSDYIVTWAAPSPAPDETKQIIVFVHGINNTADDYNSTSNTIFKRLYWSGYRGRFSAFRWPCDYLPYNTANPFKFNLSEFYAYKSANAFANYLRYLRGRQDMAGYAIDLYAHSQGNAVVSEAVVQGAPFDNYILTQGAIPAHCFDTSAPFLNKLLDADASTPTPLLPANGGYHGCFTGIQGNLINFYNTNDFALSTGTTLLYPTNWEENQRTQKPEAFLGGPSYIYYPTNLTTVAYYTFGSHYNATDLQELKAMVARSRSKAVGAQDGLHGAISGSIDLNARFGFGATRAEHSGQFTRPIQTVMPYYQQLLNSFQILP